MHMQGKGRCIITGNIANIKYQLKLHSHIQSNYVFLLFLALLSVFALPAAGAVCL
jgi:hypothetical protein